ncbi:MAG: ATP-binding cassette domain-containing protein [Desulfosporosinus sp.]|nr:ATP-binding cassette domain-containing protein [Desulfosporosinus sp.]
MLMEVFELKKYYTKSISLINRDKELIRALSDVSFVIKHNEIVGLVGESGCGKSTSLANL